MATTAAQSRCLRRPIGTKVVFPLTTRVTLGTTEFTLYSLLWRGGGKVTPLLRSFRNALAHMPQTLLLRLPPPGQEETEWLIVLDERRADHDPAARVLDPGGGGVALAKVVALAPAAQILLAEPELPPGSGIKLARAVPFALEEQLTEDIDQLSFASAGAARRRHTRGRGIALRAAGLDRGLERRRSRALAIYPDISLMPENPAQTVLWLEKVRARRAAPGRHALRRGTLARQGGLVVAGVIADPLEATEEPKPKESAILYLTREDWARVKEEFEALLEQFASLKVQLLADGPLPWLARGMNAPDAVNLLQGEFSRTTDYSERWRRWRSRRGSQPHCSWFMSPRRRCKFVKPSMSQRRSTPRSHRFSHRPCRAPRQPIRAVKCSPDSSEFASPAVDRKLFCAPCKP
jgi:hypothetical protein